ncbi:unnamed protein product, partial [Prorocentrum cordatum]
VVSDDPMKAVLEGERSICRCEVGEQCGLLVEVPLAVYVYQQTVDEVEQIDFVYVAGHKADVPDDAKTFAGASEPRGGRRSRRRVSSSWRVLKVHKKFQCPVPLEWDVYRGGRKYIPRWDDVRSGPEFTDVK